MSSSRKDQVCKVYAEQGEKAALALGKELGLKRSSVETWIGTWRRAHTPAKPARRSRTRTVWGFKRPAVIPADSVFTQFIADLQRARAKQGKEASFERDAWKYLMEYLTTLESRVY
jgi:hypothetical protein